MMDRVAMGHYFPSTSVFPCHCHSTIAPYSFVHHRRSTGWRRSHLCSSCSVLCQGILGPLCIMRTFPVARFASPRSDRLRCPDFFPSNCNWRRSGRSLKLTTYFQWVPGLRRHCSTGWHDVLPKLVGGGGAFLFPFYIVWGLGMVDFLGVLSCCPRVPSFLHSNVNRAALLYSYFSTKVQKYPLLCCQSQSLPFIPFIEE